MKCSRCEAPSSHYQGHQHLCPKHYRFGQIRATAKRRALSVPTHEDLERLTPADMKCPECREAMNWLARDGHTRVATFQHYRDGSHSIVCLSCNTRHAYAPGDSFRDMAKDQKFCPQCETFKPLAEYAGDRSRSGPMKLKSWCRSCSAVAHAQWRTNNRDYYNAKQREGRARRAPR